MSITGERSGRVRNEKQYLREGIHLTLGGNRKIAEFLVLLLIDMQRYKMDAWGVVMVLCLQDCQFAHFIFSG